MLRRLGLPRLFAIAAAAAMLLAAGAVWQFDAPVGDRLRALAPSWIGIAAVFWFLWRRVAPARSPAADPPPRPLTEDFAPLHLDRRYGDLSGLALAALDYVVVDTETTGLDPDSDRIVQIGAVRIAGGRLVEDSRFERLVDPGRPIPPASVRFHGIDDGTVADAPAIDEALQAFLDYAGDAVLIGHNIAFDLAFLNRTRPIENAAIDTMLLSIGAFPDRQRHALDDLADRFDEPVRDRHSAPADAELTARIFLKLLPHLERVGVRRFGEAQAMCDEAARRIQATGGR
ncbi:MAG: 3'-5' exonuclease [Rhodospirillaceae bacterium]